LNWSHDFGVLKAQRLIQRLRKANTNASRAFMADTDAVFPPEDQVSKWTGAGNYHSINLAF
jgi:hypothetical protein